MRSPFVLFACAGSASLMCGSDDEGTGAGPSGGPDGGASSSSGNGGSSGTGSSSGSSGNTDGGPVAGPKRPTFDSQKTLPQISRVVALPGGGWGVLTQQVTQTTSIDGKTLEPGGPILLELAANGTIKWAKTLATGGGIRRSDRRKRDGEVAEARLHAARHLGDPSRRAERRAVRSTTSRCPSTTPPSS